MHAYNNYVHTNAQMAMAMSMKAYCVMVAMVVLIASIFPPTAFGDRKNIEVANIDAKCNATTDAKCDAEINAKCGASVDDRCDAKTDANNGSGVAITGTGNNEKGKSR